MDEVVAPAMPDFENYAAWALAELAVDLGGATERRYEMVSVFAERTISESQFFAGLPQFFQECSQRYSDETKARLFMVPDFEVKLQRKPYASVVEKSYRANVLHNRAFPNPPTDGWITPTNWFERFDDLVRTQVTCKYVDALRKMGDWMKTRAGELGLPATYRSHQLDRGYYALHFYVQTPVHPSPELVGGRNEVLVTTEVQLTTQLQEAVYRLTHPIYEALRITPNVDPDAWKWDFTSNRFKAGYIGHALHMLDAMILELRDQADLLEQPEEIGNE